jgi:hydrogenase expression/formation protein HypC
MCLAMPGRVERVFEDDGLRMARVDFGGVWKDVCVETLAAVAPDDWVIVHAGVALRILGPSAVADCLRLLEEAKILESMP